MNSIWFAESWKIIFLSNRWVSRTGFRFSEKSKLTDKLFHTEKKRNENANSRKKRCVFLEVQLFTLKIYSKCRIDANIRSVILKLLILTTEI